MFGNNTHLEFRDGTLLRVLRVDLRTMTIVAQEVETGRIVHIAFECWKHGHLCVPPRYRKVPQYGGTFTLEPVEI